MKLTKLQNYLFVSVLFIFVSCSKTTTTNSRTGTGVVSDPVYRSCSEFKGLKIKAIKPYICGDNILLIADTFKGARYNWTRPDGKEENDREELYVAEKANIYHRGWYKLLVMYNTCPNISDSIYVDVKLPQGTPTCTPANNTSTYSTGITIPSRNFTSVSLNTFSNYEIEASTSSETLSLTFHEYWKTNKLEPGIYYTANNTDILEKDGMDKVFLEDTYALERWYGEINKPVYVSYVGNKLTITFCSIGIKAVTSSGTSLNSKVSGKITLP